jgi:hypothetical protein
MQIFEELDVTLDYQKLLQSLEVFQEGRRRNSNRYKLQLAIYFLIIKTWVWTDPYSFIRIQNTADSIIILL